MWTLFQGPYWNAVLQDSVPVGPSVYKGLWEFLVLIVFEVGHCCRLCLVLELLMHHGEQSLGDLLLLA